MIWAELGFAPGPLVVLLSDHGGDSLLLRIHRVNVLMAVPASWREGEDTNQLAHVLRCNGGDSVTALSRIIRIAIANVLIFPQKFFLADG